MVIAVWAGVCLAGCSCWPTAHPSGKPNIILVLADDLGYGDLGCYGQRRIQTPNLDRMAAEGIRFTQQYAGATVCAPSRCALMTGKHTGHCSIRGNVRALMKPGETTLATVLKQAGYSTACIGKWGIGHPPSLQEPHLHGFDYFFGYLSMWHAHNSYPDFLFRNGQQVPLQNVVTHPATHYEQDQAKLIGLATQKVEYSNDLFTQDALALLARKNEPFFLFLCYTVPHANNEAPELGGPGMEVPDLGIYADKDWPGPEKAKAAMITRLDRDLGVLLARLKELGIDDNTLVIFTSDNGPHKEGGTDPAFFDSNGPLRGIKRDHYEGGIRTPCLARWPGHVPAGGVSDQVWAFWDYLPTFAQLAGEPAPQDIDGISLVPTLLGRGRQKQHEYLYWELHEGGSTQAVRLGRWKAVRLAPGKPLELYDLAADLGEQHNLAADHPDVIARIEKILRQARTDEATWPLQTVAPTIPF